MLCFIIVINVMFFGYISLTCYFPPALSYSARCYFTSVQMVCLFPYLYAMVMRSGEGLGMLCCKVLEI
jgi:hypothetical protein